MVTVGMYYDVLPGQGPTFQAKFEAVVEALRAAEGHKSSFLYQRVDDPDSYAIISEWNDSEAFYGFIKSEAFPSGNSLGPGHGSPQRPEAQDLPPERGYRPPDLIVQSKRTILRSVFFHEDSYCQVEILPAVAYGYCTHEMKRIDEFASAHRDGLGFTDVYLRTEPPASLMLLGITLSDLRSTIGETFAPFDQVFTGYSSHRERCPSVQAWGFDDSVAVFAGLDEDDVVLSVWLLLQGVTKRKIGEWCRALISLPRSDEMLLADWNSSEVVLLKDQPSLESYLKSYII